MVLGKKPKSCPFLTWKCHRKMGISPRIRLFPAHFGLILLDRLQEKNPDPFVSMSRFRLAFLPGFWMPCSHLREHALTSFGRHEKTTPDRSHAIKSSSSQFEFITVGCLNEYSMQIDRYVNDIPDPGIWVFASW